MRRLIYPAVLLALTLSSCQQKLYFPDRANTPGLTEALEGKITLAAKPQANDGDSSLGRGSSASYGADLAFSPVTHLGIIASYRSVNHRKIDEGSFYNVYGGNFTGHRWELGAGYYSAFGSRGKFELYGGYGQGTLDRTGGIYMRNFSTRYHRFFFQPALGVGRQDLFSVTGGIRLAFQKFYDFRSPNTDLRYTILDDTRRMDVEREWEGFFEPFINGEIGYRFFKFNLQFGCTAQYFGENVSGALPFYMSLGLVFHFAPEFLSAAPSPSRREGGRRR